MTTAFFETVPGSDPSDAFLAGSYADMASYPPTGLGLKRGFMLVQPAAGEEPHEFAQRLIEDESSPIYGPAAPAGCIPLPDASYLFFGWARK
jgi:hypothetical protein